MKKYFNKEITIGLVTLVSLGLLYFGLNHLRGANIFKPTNTYYIRMPNVSELQHSSPVYVDGFKVGLVNDIAYDFGGTGSIVVQINLDKQMKIQTDSKVEIKTGLTSGGYLNLIPNKYVSTYYQVGDTLDGFHEKGIMDKVSDDLMPQIESILPRLDSILQGIQILVSHPALTQSFEQLSTTTSNLEMSTRHLNLLLSDNLLPIVNNLNQVSSDFAVVSSQFKQLDLNTTINSANRSLQNLEEMTLQLNGKNNSLGLFLNDRTIYDRLDTTFVNAADLLLDLKQNPKRYVHFSIFGRR